MTRPCKYSKYGCCDVVKFTEMRVHEEACPYTPYSCPFNGCNYDGVLLYDHILRDHTLDGQATNVQATSDMGMLRGTKVTLKKGSPFHALLHRDGKSIFVLLNGGDILTGRSLSLVRVCPRPGPDEEEAEKVNYVMVVKDDEPGSLSLTAPGVQYVRQLEGHQPERFLFVPDAFWGSSGSITVTVYI
jgi:E3 ubiquitin-protein ligase SIAH1